MNNKKNILWAVTGGIAIYKSLDIISELKKENYEIQVIMSKYSQKFITSLTFEALTEKPIYYDTFSNPMIHINLSDKSDLFIIAPASYDIIGKIANGIADDIVSTIAGAINCKKLIAPAMNKNMYFNSICQKNIKTLKENNYEIIEPENGFLACGHYGIGRLAKNIKIITHIKNSLHNKKNNSKQKNNIRSFFKGKTILISAGATQEKIDPVRHIGNSSSGKMANSLARVAIELNCKVKLVCAYMKVEPIKEADIFFVKTTLEMLDELEKQINSADILIMCAAVSDYRPKYYSNIKIKKSNNKDEINLKLIKNPDILTFLTKKKKKQQIFIGFSAESNSTIENSTQKLIKKNIDMIIVNDISKKDIGFESDYNEVNLIFKNGHKKHIQKMTKYNLSIEIFKEIQQHFYKNK